MKSNIIAPEIDSTTFEDMYFCYVDLDEFYGHTNFEIQPCYFDDRKEMGQKLPYEKLISDYNLLNDENKMYAEGAINELFFLDEVLKLEAHLAKFPGAKFSYYKKNLPIDNNEMARSWLPLGGGLGMIDLPDHLNELGFIVKCCFDTRYCGCPKCIQRQAA